MSTWGQSPIGLMEGGQLPSILTPELFNRPKADIATARKPRIYILRGTDFSHSTLKVSLKSPIVTGFGGWHSNSWMQ